MKKLLIILISISIIFNVLNFILIEHKTSAFLGSLPTVSSGDTITSTGWNNMIEKINNTEATSTKVGSIYNTATTSDYLLVANGTIWNATSSMIIDNTGNVGIATTTPAVGFVVNNLAATSSIGIMADASGFGGSLIIEAPNGNCYTLTCNGVNAAGCVFTATSCAK